MGTLDRERNNVYERLLERSNERQCVLERLIVNDWVYLERERERERMYMRDKQKKKVTSGNVYIRYAMRIRKRERE